MTKSLRRRRTRCICRRTFIRCSACGKIRSAPISPRRPRRMITPRRIFRIKPIQVYPTSRISLSTHTCKWRGIATRSRSVESLPKLKKFFVTQLAIDTALAAIPARFALERGRWDEAAQLPVRDSQFPPAQSISYFARALGAARSGDVAAARAELAHLDEIEAKLAAANNDYWAGQTLSQKQAVAAWVMFSDGQRDEAIAAMRKAADLDDASEKNVAMENKLVPIRALLGELYLT